MRGINGAVDWAELAREVGADPLEGDHDDVARRAIAFLLGEVTLRDAVDYPNTQVRDKAAAIREVLAEAW
jgi:hypothetical protein